MPTNKKLGVVLIQTRVPRFLADVIRKNATERGLSSASFIREALLAMAARGEFVRKRSRPRE